MSDDMWADFDAAPLNLYLSEPETGIWCPTCQLPSAIRFSISTDPSHPAPDGPFTTRCLQCEPPQ